MIEDTDKKAVDVRNILLALVTQNNGNWEKTLEDIKNKKDISEEEVLDCLSISGNFITLIDNDFPEKLKQSYRPPFVLFYDGDLNVLLQSKHLLCVLNDHNASQYATETIQDIVGGLTDKCTFVIGFGPKKNNELIKYLLSRGSSIIAVLDRGIGIENTEDKELYQSLKDNQLILSTFPKSVVDRTPQTKFECSKLQVGLCKRILVGAITKNSFLNIALGMALENGDDLYCIPFQVGSNYITNRFIHDGATLVETSETLSFDAELE